MTKEEYLHHRNSKQISLELIFEYYKEQCGEMGQVPLVDILELFAHTFTQYHQMFGVDFEIMFKYYDRKFKINSLKDKVGKIINFLSSAD
jgi:hypothetical protein